MVNSESDKSSIATFQRVIPIIRGKSKKFKEILNDET